MVSAPLYLDEDVRVLLAQVLRSRGYDASHVIEHDRSGKSDAEQLAFAVKQSHAILTHNIKDYIELEKAYKQLSH